MTKLQLMSETGILEVFMNGILKLIEDFTEAKVEVFNMVIQSEDGHCIVSASDRRMEEE